MKLGRHTYHWLRWIWLCRIWLCVVRSKDASVIWVWIWVCRLPLDYDDVTDSQLWKDSWKHFYLYTRYLNFEGDLIMTDYYVRKNQDSYTPIFHIIFFTPSVPHRGYTGYIYYGSIIILSRLLYIFGQECWRFFKHNYVMEKLIQNKWPQLWGEPMIDLTIFCPSQLWHKIISYQDIQRSIWMRIT